MENKVLKKNTNQNYKEILGEDFLAFAQKNQINKKEQQKIANFV